MRLSIQDTLLCVRKEHIPTHRGGRNGTHTKAGLVARQLTKCFAVLAIQIIEVVVAMK